MEHCRREQADVLLIAGDLFSELIKPETFADTVAHLSYLFRSFLLRGGTVVALTGNHDNDIYCDTLRRAFQLAAPIDAREGDLLPAGRLYLAVSPVHFRLADHLGRQVQFVCMPYPTMGRYLSGTSQQQYTSFVQRAKILQSTYAACLQRIRGQLRPGLPAVLVTHVNIFPSPATALFRFGGDDIRIRIPLTAGTWSYVALGHLHRPQAVLGHANVRYAGSIERLEIGECEQQKSVVVVQINGSEQPAVIRSLPLPATPFYDVRIRDPASDMATLRRRYPEASRALVRCHVTYNPRCDNLSEILAEITRTFPRCYERTWSVGGRPSSNRPPRNSLPPAGQRIQSGSDRSSEAPLTDWLSLLETGGDLRQVVLGYLRHCLSGDPDRETLVSMAERLLLEQAK